MSDPTNPLLTATSLGVGTSGTHTLNATTANDYYRFTLSGRSSVNVTLSGLDSNADVQLLTASGLVLQESTNTGTTTDDINSPDLSAGVYYLRVFAANGSSSTHYTLGVQAVTNARTDILWRNYSTGQNVIWAMNGTTSVSSSALLTAANTHWHLEGSADFTGDGQTDLLWRNDSTGENQVWAMNGTTFNTSLYVKQLSDLNWRISGTGDFNQDGQTDILWRNYSTGQNVVWAMNGTTSVSSLALVTLADLNWQLEGAADFTSDGQMDLLWRNYSTGQNVVWAMNGTTSLSSLALTAVNDLNWHMGGTGDFNQDGQTDIVWRHYGTGRDVIWLMQGATLQSSVEFNQLTDLNWQIAGALVRYGVPGDVHLGGTSTASAFDLGNLNGQATYQSTLNSSGSDYYRFTLSAANPNVYARVTASHLDLLSSSGSVLQSAATGGLTRLQSTLGSGSYYLRVSGAPGYTLVVADTSAPPSVTTSLVNDTARSGLAPDQRTADPTVSVQVGSEHWLSSLSAGFNTTAPTNFLALGALLGNHFTLTPTQLQAINGNQPLTDGVYVLHLRATGVDDVTALTTDLTFTLDTTTSAPSGLHLTTGTGNTTNVTTPTVTGQAEVGALVKVYGAGNVLLGQGVADSTGNWQAPLAALADGTYNVTAISTDVAGNVSAASMVLTLVLDRQAPLSPTLLPLAAADDTGESASDGITARTTPTLTGQAEAGTAITLFNNGVAIGQTRTNASGVWQFTTTPLPQGLVSLSATATDAAGNVSPVSAPLVLTIDSVAPAAPTGVRLTTGSDSGQSHTDGRTNMTTPTVEGNATAGVRVQLWGNGQLWGQQKADSSGHWQITSSPLTDDHYLLSAFALDVAGNRSAASLPLDVFVDTQAPTAPTTLHLSATTDTGSSSSDGVTANPTPTVVGQAAANALVQLLQQNQVIAQTIADGTGAWQITIPTLTEGAHTLTTTATDVAGNVSVNSAPLSLVIDTQAPSSPTNVQLASPTAGTSGTGALTKVSMPLFTGNATAGTFITLLSDGVVVGQTPVGSDGTWQVQAQTLTDGAHVITATAKDLAGNVSSATAPLTVTIDATAPVLVLDTDTAIVLTQQARLSGYVDDLGSGVISAQYAFDNLAPVALTLSAYGDFDQTFDWTGVGDGAHTLTLTTTDTAGNVLNQTVAVTVNQNLTAPILTAALATDTGFDDTDRVTANPQVMGKLAGGNTSAQLRVGLDGATAASFTTVALASDGTFTLDQALINTLAGGTLAEGDHTLHLQARDDSGNLLSVADMAFTLDTMAPTLTVTTPLDVALVNNAHLAGTVNETGSGLVALQYRFDGQAPLALGVNDMGSFNDLLDWTGISNGTHTLTISGTDAAGNVTAFTPLNVNVQRDLTQPGLLTAALVQDTGSSATDGITTNATITGTVNGTSVVQLLATLDNSTNPTFTDVTTQLANGAFTLNLATLFSDTLGDGDQTLRLQALDAQGNVIGVSHVALTLDTAAPDLRVTSLINGITWKAGQEQLHGTVTDASDITTLSYQFDGAGAVQSLTPNALGAFDLQTLLLPSTLGSHTLALQATDVAGNQQALHYKFLIKPSASVLDTDVLDDDTDNPPDPPIDNGGGSSGGGGASQFLAGGGAGGSNYAYPHGGIGGGAPSADPLGDLTPSTPYVPPTGSGYGMEPLPTYLEKLAIIFDQAVDSITTNGTDQNAHRKAALEQREALLMAIGDMVDEGQFYNRMAPVFQGIYAEANNQPVVTTSEAHGAGTVLASELAPTNATTPVEAVKVQVYQAALLAVVNHALLDQQYSFTGADQAAYQAMAAALLELGHTYAALNPTAATDSSTTPNWLDALWRAQQPGADIQAALSTGITALNTLLAGVADPLRALQFVNNLVQVATNVEALQDDLHDAKFIRELVEFGFEYAKLNPTGTVASGDAAVNTFLDTLWKGGDDRQAQGGLSQFFEGFETESQRIKLLDFEDKLLKADGRLQGTGLQDQKHDATFIGNLVGLGSSYAALNPSTTVGAEDPQLFLNTLWHSNTAEEVQKGTSEFKNFIENSGDQIKLLKLGDKILDVIKLAKIEDIKSTPDSVEELFEIARAFNISDFDELSNFQASHVTLIAGLNELQKTGNQGQREDYWNQIEAIVTQLSQGIPNVSRYINTQALDSENSDNVLVSSTGNVAAFPTTQQQNLLLRREPNYDAVIVKKEVKITFFDYAVEDGDKVDIYLNGKLLKGGVDLLSNSIFGRSLPNLLSKPYTLTLDKTMMKAGENVLEVRSIDQANSLTTIGVDFNSNDTIYGNWRHTAAVPVGQAFKITFGLPKIRVNGDAYPYSADHIIDVLRRPQILTIDRAGAQSRRDANFRRYKELGGVESLTSYDRDESPPAVFKESINAHVRLIPSMDNQFSGNQIGIALNYYGSKIIKLQDNWNVDFYATVPTIPTPQRVPDLEINWTNKII